MTISANATATGSWKTIDGNEAAASVAYRLARGHRHLPDHALVGDGRALRTRGRPEHRPNLWGDVPTSSRCRARRAPPARCTARCRPARSRPAFTASQGLLLMIPNMFKIAGRAAPVRPPRQRARGRHARAVDLRRSQRRDGGARRPAGRMLCSGSVQEAQDLAAVAHAATLDVAPAVPALLRRVPHVARGREDRAR